MKESELYALLEPRLPDRKQVVITMGDLIGLGDTAVYSTLPERLSALGYEVYLDADSDASNPEIGELFWERNPFIKGRSYLKPNAGYHLQGLIYELANRFWEEGGIAAVERAHGLLPPYSMCPKVYYSPKPPPIDVSKTVLLDYGSVSSVIARDRVGEHIKMAAGRFRNPTFLQILHPSWVVMNQEQYIESTYLCTSIYEYLDLIAACRAWCGSEAGGQALASAIRGPHVPTDYEARPQILVAPTRQTHNSGLYRFANASYRPTALDGREDFWDVREVEDHKYRIACRVRGVQMRQRLEEARNA